MNSLKVAICDDDKLVRISVYEYLKNEFTGKRLWIDYYTFEDGVDLVTSCIDFDIIILDIEMEYMNGFRVRDELFNRRAQSKIIFLTDYDERVHQAFGKNVYGFVTKNRLEELSHYLNIIVCEYKEHQLLYLAGEAIDLFEIVYIKANNGYCEFYDSYGNQRVFRILISQVVEKLENYPSLRRVHRSYIVNLRFIKKCEMMKVGLMFRGIAKKIEIPVSHRFEKNIQRTYTEYLKSHC